MGNFFPHNQSEFLTRSRDKENAGLQARGVCLILPSCSVVGKLGNMGKISRFFKSITKGFQHLCLSSRGKKDFERVSQT